MIDRRRQKTNFFKGHNGMYYDGFRAYHMTPAEFLAKQLPYEKSASIFDVELSQCFDDYYAALINMGYTDIACAGVSLDTPDKSFGYIVGPSGEAFSMVIKHEPYNWTHIYNGDLLFEDLDDGRQFLEGVKLFRNMGTRGGTLSTISMELFKKHFGKNYGVYFPDCRDETGEVYEFLRDGFRGGWNYMKPDIGLKTIEGGYIYDKNSLYPWILACASLPYGKGKLEQGAPSKELIMATRKGQYFLFIRFYAKFHVKHGFLPFVTLEPNTPANEKGEGVLTLTFPEYVLFCKHYETERFEYLSYIKYNAARGLARKFVMKYYEKKTTAKTPVERKTYKGVLNYVTGSFSKKIDRYNLVKVDGEWRVKKTELNEKSMLYLGFAITSLGRVCIVKDAQEHFDTFLYSDTDSLHLTEPAADIRIGDDIGQYKLETIYKEACYIKRKWYGYKDGEGVHLVTAGIPAKDARRIEQEQADKNIFDIMTGLTL